MCCSDTAVSAVTEWTRSRSLLGAIRGKKKKKCMGTFQLDHLPYMIQTLFCVLCQNQIYQNILRIKAFGQERCLPSYQASDTLSGRHCKAISNTSMIISVDCVPSTHPPIWDNIFHTSSKHEGSISVIVVSRQKTSISEKSPCISVRMWGIATIRKKGFQWDKARKILFNQTFIWLWAVSVGCIK